MPNWCETVVNEFIEEEKTGRVLNRFFPTAENLALKERLLRNSERGDLDSSTVESMRVLTSQSVAEIKNDIYVCAVMRRLKCSREMAWDILQKFSSFLEKQHTSDYQT